MAAKKNTKKRYILADDYNNVEQSTVLEGMVEVKELLDDTYIDEGDTLTLYELVKVGTITPTNDVILTRTNGTIEVIR